MTAADIDNSQNLFPALLGKTFERLPATVRALHQRTGTQHYHGRAQVTRGTHPLSRLCAWITRLPPAGEIGIEVEIRAEEQQEIWLRNFGGHRMPSRLWRDHTLLAERLGPVRFGFRLTVEDQAIVWRVAKVRLLGLPLPAVWFSEVLAREFESAGRYHFDVIAALPFAGRMVRYQGWLHVE